MKLWQKFLIISGIICVISTAFAFNLQQARREGIVVEQPNGYLIANDSSVQSEVDRINSERKREYERMAKEKNVPVRAVEAMAAEEIRKKR